MYEEVVIVAVLSALFGLVVGLLMRSAAERAKVLCARGLAMLRGKGKRGQGKPRKKRVAKVKDAKEPAASRRQPKAKPIELATSAVVAEGAKPRRKVGRPSKAELVRRAALEQEKATPGVEHAAPSTTAQATAEPAAALPDLKSGQLQELAVFNTADCRANQSDTPENASST